jgi:hypothetical protein
MTRAPLIAICLLALAGPVAAQTISVTGAPELVLSHTDMNCGRSANGSGRDVTDVPPSAFRHKDGSVVLISGNQNNHYAEGPSLDQVRRVSCGSLLKPLNDPDPAKFSARRWLFGVYAKDYENVFGFVHNEYHGDEFNQDGCEKTSARNFECWYAASVIVKSQNGGRSFGPDTAGVIAAPPAKFATGRKRIGAGTPKIVGNPNDGFIYVLVNYLDRNRDKGAEQCVLRGKSMDDWRAWDGSGFTIDMGSPYKVQRGPDCTPVIPFVVQSVKYIPALKQFVALGQRRGVLLYVFSADLIKWSEPKELMRFMQKQGRRNESESALDYFSLLDPTSASINFDTLEQRPYLYYVKYLGRGIQRDVMRVAVKITP